MNQVFVDTVGWVALKDKSDGLHDTAELLNKSLLLQKRRYVTTFIVMRHEGIWECLTNDHHFEQMGYQKLL